MAIRFFRREEERKVNAGGVVGLSGHDLCIKKVARGKKGGKAATVAREACVAVVPTVQH